MALIRSDYAELEAVISRLVNGELTEEDGDRLVTLLRGNAQARAVYLQYESMHAQLSWMFQGQNSLSATAENDLARFRLVRFRLGRGITGLD